MKRNNVVIIEKKPMLSKKNIKLVFMFSVHEEI